MMKLEYLVTLTQKQLMGIFRKQYRREIAAYKKGNFLLVKGNAPVMLVAHLDTVHRETVKILCQSHDGNVLMSPQGIGGDDRCGVYALCKLYESTREKPWLLFTCDEETGGNGANTFCLWHEQGKLPKELGDLKMLVEIDRKGSKDAVYYDCDNREFEEYITSKGYVTQYGSFSDISYIAPELGIAAVNLSSGYYNAHTQHEYINRKHLDATIEKVREMIRDATMTSFPKYKYIEKVYVRQKINDSYKSLWNYPRHGWDYGEYYGSYRDYDSTLTAYEQGKLRENSIYSTKYPADLPVKYRQMYDELLELYSEDELESLREQFGDAIIQEIYDQEITGLYDWQDDENTENANDSTKGGDNTAKK